MVTIEIDTGQGVRQVTIGPKQITLGYLEDMEEAQATGRWAPLISALTSLLKLTREETRELTIEQFNQIGATVSTAMREQTAIPNG